jgi:hypothetical protein
MIVQQSGGYKRLTASGNVSKVPATIIGFYVASTNVGTIQFYDDPGVGTTTPITGVITPAVGFNPLYAYASQGINAVIAGTALDVTVVYA